VRRAGTLGISRLSVRARPLTLATMAIRVLVVDDDPLFADAIGRALRERGYDIVGQAASGAEARDGVSRLRPDAILVDVNLPDTDGIALATELVSSDRALRVLLTSSDSTAAPLRLVRRSGASGFLAKDELLARDLEAYLG
jgi:DNA-binding NarL/FixJ family response regulator